MSLADSAWPKYGGKDLRNTCIQAIGGNPFPSPQVKWRTYKGGSSLSTPVLDSYDNVYVGDYNGWLTVIDKDGNVKWQYFIDSAGIDGSAAISNDGTIYIGSYANSPGRLFALNPDGSLKWVHESDDTFYSPTIAPDGTIYVAGEKYLNAINPDGTLKWRQIDRKVFKHPPAINVKFNVIYSFGEYAYDICAHWLEDGQLVWRYSTPRNYSGPVVDSNGHIYAAGAPDVYALYPDGTLKWRSQTTDRNLGLALGVDGFIFVGCDDGGLYAFDPDTGNLKWKHQRRDWVFNPCVSASGVIYGTDRDGYIFALDHQGVLLWEFYPYNYGMGDPASDIILDDKGVLYYQDWGGYVVTLIVESVGVRVQTKSTQLLVDAHTGKTAIFTR